MPPLSDAEHQREAEKPEQGRGKAKISEILGRDVDAVLGPHQAAFQAGKAYLHQHHQGRTDKNLSDVDKLVSGLHIPEFPLLGSPSYVRGNGVCAQLNLALMGFVLNNPPRPRHGHHQVS